MDTEKIKDRILENYQRLGLEDGFKFSCHPGVSCFNTCCGDVNIALSPYDILRLKNRLGLTAEKFIERYGVRPFTPDQKLPVVLLRMDDHKEGKPCPLVTDKGCSVYEDRPWPCRMYPVGEASARTENDPDGPEFHFLMSEDPCEGFAEDKDWTIRQWKENQGVGPYDEMGEAFKEINLHPHFRKGGTLNPQQMDMYYTACYNLERFHSFVFESKFLERYDVEPEVVEQIRDDEEALLLFGFRWLKTCLFNEGTIPLKQETIDDYKKKLEEQGKSPA